MTLAVAAAAGALTIWLVVRIANRRERLLKRTVGVLAVLFAYPISFGPACWLTSRGLLPDSVGIVYKPLLFALADVRQAFGPHFYPRPGWHPLIAWGELNDAGPWHKSNMSQDWYQDTVAGRWAARYARPFDWDVCMAPKPYFAAPASDPDEELPRRVICEFSDGTEVVLAEWLSRADADEIRARAFMSDDRQLVDVRVEMQDDADDPFAE